MENFRAGISAFLGLSARRKVTVILCAALIVALIAALCISINMRSHIQKDYATVRNQIGESLYSNLNMMMQTFDMTTVPNADVENVILPQMKEYFIASSTLNEVLVKTYGSRYAVLTEADTTAIRSAFDAYQAAYRSGASTDLAQSDMQACMNRVRELLMSRFNESAVKAGR